MRRIEKLISVFKEEKTVTIADYFWNFDLLIVADHFRKIKPLTSHSVRDLTLL